MSASMRAAWSRPRLQETVERRMSQAQELSALCLVRAWEAALGGAAGAVEAEAAEAEAPASAEAKGLVEGGVRALGEVALVKKREAEEVGRRDSSRRASRCSAKGVAASAKKKRDTWEGEAEAAAAAVVVAEAGEECEKG